MYDPRSVSRTMIDRAAPLGVEMTNLKLQKLLYIAHGAMLAVHNRALVNTTFAAWKYGPVLESLYHDLKIFGSDSIKSGDSYIQQWNPIPQEDAEAISIVDAVLGHFGPMTGYGLIQWSHLPDGPWNAVYKDNTKNLTIADPEIKRYFREKVIKQPA